jgi:pyridoxine 4-dehydrogenase
MRFLANSLGAPNLRFAMTVLLAAGTFLLGDRPVRRMGYGAMRLAGKGVFGPPADRKEAIAVLREAVASGVNHIDTSDFYGPHVTNQIIKEALHPYPADLVIVTKVGARRGADASWNRADSPEELVQAVHDNLKNLGLDALDIVNARSMYSARGLAEGTMEPQITAIAELQRKGLVKHIGVSNVTPAQIAQARSLVPIVCVQNQYNLAHRGDDTLIDQLGRDGIAYVPFFPLGGFSPLQSETLTTVASDLDLTPMQTALAWLLHRAPNVLAIPGTSSRAHLRENLAVAEIALPKDALNMLNGIANREM